jgi:transcriptional regulator with XRE-family HTH domain
MSSSICPACGIASQALAEQKAAEKYNLEATRSMEEVKISTIIRSARSALGASQSDLAVELDVSQSSIARLETGNGTIPANILLRAINLFSSYGIDITGILENDPQIKFSESFFVAQCKHGPGFQLPRDPALNGVST